MGDYQTRATVAADGTLNLTNLPFADGEEVEVSIRPRPAPAARVPYDPNRTLAQMQADARRDLERRIAESGVKPMTEAELSKPAMAWPEDEPIEPFLELIRTIRSEADPRLERILNDPVWADDDEEAEHPVGDRNGDRGGADR